MSVALCAALAGLLTIPLVSKTSPDDPDSLVDVLTNRYDNWRTGANTRETKLTVQNVNKKAFGKLFEREVEGDVYGQPLIKTAVPIQGLGPRMGTAVLISGWP